MIPANNSKKHTKNTPKALNRGWVKLHRQSVKSEVWQNPHLWHLWSFCLLKANHQDRHVKLPSLAKSVFVKRGQFVTGRESLLNDLFPIKKKHKPNAMTIWRRLKRLEEMGNITIHTVGNRCSLVTVPNYEIYQNTPENSLLILDKKGLYSRNAKSVQQKCQKCATGSPCLDSACKRKQGEGVQQKHKSCSAETPKVFTNKKGKNNNIIYGGKTDGNESPKAGKTFVVDNPPTPEQVGEYAKTIDFPELDAEYFCERYAVDGWKLANGNKMRSWKKSVITWKHNQQKSGQGTGRGERLDDNQSISHEATPADIERLTKAGVFDD